MLHTVGPYRALADCNAFDAIEVGSQLGIRPIGAVQPTARWALHDPREDFRRQRLRDMGGASRGPLDGEPVDAFGLIGVEPALQRAPAHAQVLGNLAMASPTSGHQDRLAT